MRQLIRHLFAATLVACLTAGALDAEARDWPNWSGPHGNRTSIGNDAFPAPTFGLQRAWVSSLGSGYSGISVVGDTVLTGFSDGEHDYLIALDAASGDEKWRYTIGDAYGGHDGSDDGPLATPVVADGKVYGLGAWGELFALRLDDGGEIWKRRIDEELGARRPDYGFTTSPVISGGVVVVQTGGDTGRAISGLDGATGETLWTTADDSVGYESPLELTIGGEPQVLAVTTNHLFGLSPRSGEVLWQHRHNEASGEGFAHPLKVGDDSILLNYWPEAALFRIGRADGEQTVTELWRRNTLRSTYSTPVHWQGYLYGYSGSILTCVDAASGDTVWKSRPPGGGSLILVDGYLVIQTEDGDVVVADASPAGYTERARGDALERGHLTAPAFAGGRIFTRNLTQIASLSITDSAVETVAARTALESEALGDFGDWVGEVRAAEDKKALIDAFLQTQAGFPVLEGKELVHFVYRGEVPDLALTGNLLREGETTMARIEGTDFYYKSLRLDPASVYTYGFNVFDEFRADPLNPNRVGPEGGERSLLATVGWASPQHLEEAPGERGEIVEYKWTSEILGNERSVQVYLPPGYAAGDERYPLLVVNLGDMMLAQGRMANTLDNLVGNSVAPLIAAFVPRGHWAEYAGSRPHDYARALRDELLPYLDTTYRTRTDTASRGAMGVGSGGFIAVYSAFSQPGVFGKVASQSFYLGDKGDELMQTIRDAPQSDMTFYVEWSRRDYFDADSGLDAERHSSELTELLASKAYSTTSNIVGHGPGFPGWSAGHARLLEALFPN